MEAPELFGGRDKFRFHGAQLKWGKFLKPNDSGENFVGLLHHVVVLTVKAPGREEKRLMTRRGKETKNCEDIHFSRGEKGNPSASLEWKSLTRSLLATR